MDVLDPVNVGEANVDGHTVDVESAYVLNVLVADFEVVSDVASDLNLYGLDVSLEFNGLTWTASSG